MNRVGAAPFVQGDSVRDFVFPLAQASQSPDGSIRYERYLGTAFFIGKRGFALTAAHVLDARDPKHALLVGLFADDGWYAFQVDGVECHPTEDVAILRVDGGPWNSPFRASGTWEGASREYQLWGYPLDAALVDTNVAGKVTSTTPDLVYFKGYVRRRITRSLNGLTGASFFELSQPAYGGCSGGPLWYRGDKGVWRLIGIYVGYLPASKPDEPFLCVGYAVREEAFRDWAPGLLQRSIAKEAAEGTLGIRSASAVPAAPGSAAGV